MMEPRTVRPSPIAGRWYPDKPAKLANMVDQFLTVPLELTVQFDKPIKGILSPHAGLIFSGGIAGKSMRFTQGTKADLVVIIGPSHHDYPAALLSTQHSHYQTPFGDVPVAHDMLNQLGDIVPFLPVKNDPEHAIEIELPFLQRTLSAFELLPLAMLDQSWEAAHRLGEALAKIVQGRSVLFVASSDLSHFYSPTQAQKLDKVILDYVAAYDPQAIIQADDEGRGFACGRGAIAAVMVAVQRLGATHATLVGYGHSGEIQPMDKVVGYGAAVFS